MVAYPDVVAVELETFLCLTVHCSSAHRVHRSHHCSSESKMNSYDLSKTDDSLFNNPYNSIIECSMVYHPSANIPFDLLELTDVLWYMLLRPPYHTAFFLPTAPQKLFNTPTPPNHSLESTIAVGYW